MQKNLNLKVKFIIRNFAPVYMRKVISDYFNIDQDSPYMLLVSDVHESKNKNELKENKKLFGIEKLNIKI